MGVTEQMRQHQERCVLHQVRLRMLVHDLTGALVTSRVIYETAQGTSAIVAEAKAGCRTALAPAAGGQARFRPCVPARNAAGPAGGSSR